jgi:hypothetical protein
LFRRECLEVEKLVGSGQFQSDLSQAPADVH